MTTKKKTTKKRAKKTSANKKSDAQKKKTAKKKLKTKKKAKPSKSTKKAGKKNAKKTSKRSGGKTATKKSSSKRDRANREASDQRKKNKKRSKPSNTSSHQESNNKNTEKPELKSKSTKRGDFKPSSPNAVFGRIKRNPDGFGFFICEDDSIEDVYIPKEEMFGVFSNDRIEININRRGGKFGRNGKVLRVLERDTDRFIGRLHYDHARDQHYLKDSAHNWGQELLVENPVGAKVGELVLVDVQRFPDPKKKPKSLRAKDLRGTFTGVVTSSIGSEVDPNTDNIRILHEHSVPVEFSEKALKQARQYGPEVKESDKKGRRDLRNTPLITIDGVTAKDFDDAVYVSKTKSGFKLIVAIADVSHYVKKDTILDAEAYQKGTSVYLANYVCPMLPEELSNGLCSLNPNVDRLCFCCEMNLRADGEVENFNFFEGVMKSHARVTYGEAQEVLEGGVSEHSDTVCEVIKTAAELSETLNIKRMKEGSIDFNVPSTKVLVNDLGEPTDIVNEERIFSHRLIEELMLLTNICASKFLDNKKVPQLYRIHETPDKENLSKLHLMLGSFLNTSIGKIKSSFDFQKLAQKLENVEDSNVSSIAQGFILRSMKQAQYSHQNLGHFGLNFTHYAHFTSPIRRYPDLVIHRQIKSVINKKYSRYLEEDVASMGTVLSAAEQRAVKAERKVVSVKKARFFESHVGEEFDGYISSIVKFGAFVTLREFPLDGLIKLDEIGDDHFVYDEETWTLRGRKTGKTFRVGDKVRIKVLNVDISDGKIDFSLLEHEGAKSKESFYDKFRADVVATNSSQKRYSSKDEIKKQNFKKEKKHRGGKKNKSKGGASSMFSSSSSARGLAFGKKRKKNKK